MKADAKKSDPEAQLRSFIERFDAKDQKVFSAVRTAVRKLFPKANELAYNYNHTVVISYSPSEHGIEGIVTISLLADGVRLYFMHGPKLSDPKKLLQGSAKQVRYIAVESASRLAHPDVKALIAGAVDHASVAMTTKGKGSLIIKSDGAKKAPRKKSVKAKGADAKPKARKKAAA
jgi:hypothetical protein